MNYITLRRSPNDTRFTKDFWKYPYTNPYYHELEPQFRDYGDHEMYFVTLHNTWIEIIRWEDGSLLLELFFANQNDKKTPKGMARKMLCAMLDYILYTTTTTVDDIIQVDAKRSNGDLIHKVYYPLGFKFKFPKDEGRESEGGVMFTQIKNVMSWCETNHKNKRLPSTTPRLEHGTFRKKYLTAKKKIEKTKRFENQLKNSNKSRLHQRSVRRSKQAKRKSRRKLS
tara:strand:- start:39 stop:716 length:678 start_codon:yes stop_codon:yes gene_type:complete